MLDNLTVFHDAHAVSDLAHDGQVMRDEKHRHADIAFEVREQIKDLRLNGDIERGCRFIRNQKVRTIRQGHRNHDALTLPAGQLVRVRS